MFLRTMNGKLTRSIDVRLLLMNEFNHSIKSRCMTTKTWRKARRRMGGRGTTSCGQIPCRGNEEEPLEEQ
jgi:hypothetical protein